MIALLAPAESQRLISRIGERSIVKLEGRWKICVFPQVVAYSLNSVKNVVDQMGIVLLCVKICQ